MDKMTFYAVALDQQSRAMPLVDLEEVRQKLLRYGWIEDAHVSRRLPDTLLIQIDERTPAAIWQDNGQLTLIDARSEEHTSELQSLMRNSYAVFCLKKKNDN